MHKLALGQVCLQALQFPLQLALCYKPNVLSFPNRPDAQPPIHWVSDFLSPDAKRSEREDDHLFHLVTRLRKSGAMTLKEKSKTIPREVLRIPGGWGSQISRHSAHKGGKVISRTLQPPSPPREYSWYSFLLGTESTAGPYGGRKDYVNEKFQWHYRESNPRPSGL